MTIKMPVNVMSSVIFTSTGLTDFWLKIKLAQKMIMEKVM